MQRAVNKIRAIVIVFRPKAIIRTVSSLHSSVAADTCVAMNEWVQHPTARTALDDILPCVDNATAQETLAQSKDVTFQLVNVVNNFITNVSNKNFPTQVKLEPSVSYNQTGPLVPVLCNPYQPNKTRRVCEAGEVDFNNAAQVSWNNILYNKHNGFFQGRMTCNWTFFQFLAMYNWLSRLFGRLGEPKFFLS